MSIEGRSLSRKSLKTPTAGSQGLTGGFSEASLEVGEPLTSTTELFMKSK